MRTGALCFGDRGNQSKTRLRYGFHYGEIPFWRVALSLLLTVSLYYTLNLQTFCNSRCLLLVLTLSFSSFLQSILTIMLNLAISSLALFGAVAFAQERCDAPYPEVYCNTTEILAFKSSDCSPYHVFIARGSDEPYPGRLGNLTSGICGKLGKDECTFEDIEYPAKSTAWGKEEWCKSASKGAVNGQAQVKAYAEKCTDSKLILVGLSQGASVALDILGGGGGDVFECVQEINEPFDRSTSPGSQGKHTDSCVYRP